jgi:hypothetical protein
MPLFCEQQTERLFFYRGKHTTTGGQSLRRTAGNQRTRASSSAWYMSGEDQGTVLCFTWQKQPRVTQPICVPNAPSFVRCGCRGLQWVLGQITDRSDVRVWNKFGATVESLLAPLRSRTHTQLYAMHTERDEWEWKGQASSPAERSESHTGRGASLLLRALQESRWKCWNGTTGIQVNYTGVLIRGVWPRIGNGGRRAKKKQKRACSELAGTRWICRKRILNFCYCVYRGNRF